MRWIFLATVALCSANPAHADTDILTIDRPPCILPSSGFNPQLAQPAIAKRKHLERKGKHLAAVVDWLYKRGVAANVEFKLERELRRAHESLQWTGERGALIEVVLEVDRLEQQPPRLLYTSYLGEGSCYYNALLDYIAKPRVTQGPAAGYKIDEDASYYVWATVKNGNLVSEVVMPGNRGPLLSKALADSAAQAVVLATSEERRHDRLLSLAAATQLRLQDEEAQARLAEMTAAVRFTHDQRKTITTQLNNAIEAEQRAAGAAAWIGQLQTVLTIAQLVVQTKAMLSPVAPGQTLSKMDEAKTAAELAGIVGGFQNTSENSKVTHRGQLTLIETEQKRVTRILIDEAVRAGAPPYVVPLDEF